LLSRRRRKRVGHIRPLSDLGGRALRTPMAASPKSRTRHSKLSNDTYAGRAARGGLRSFYIFDFAINGVVI
jgi:hypothetical protein